MQSRASWGISALSGAIGRIFRIGPEGGTRCNRAPAGEIFLLDKLYYYSHLFFKTFLVRVSPSIQPSLILGATIGLPLAFIVDNAYIFLKCQASSPWWFISICLGSMFLSLIIYEVNNRKEIVIMNEPKFSQNRKMNLFIMILIDIFALTCFFLNAPVGKYLLKLCY